MKADRLVGVGTVVVVPVEQSGRRAGRQLQRMHAEHTADVHFAGAGHQFIAHHAHHGAGHNAQVLFDRRPALHGADLHVSGFHPLIDDGGEFRHLEQRLGRHTAGADIFLDSSQF